MGRAPRLRHRYRGSATGRRRRHQERDLRGRRRVCLRLPQGRGRHPSPRAHLALRCECATPHFVRVGLRVPCDRRQGRGNHQSRRLEDRHLSRERRRRPARQQDRFGGALHASSDRHRGNLPERALAAQESRDGDEDFARAPVRTRGAQEARGTREVQQGQEGHRVGQSDSLLRAAAVSDGEGPSYRRRNRQYRRGPRWRDRSIHRVVPDGRAQGRRRLGSQLVTHRALLFAARRERHHDRYLFLAHAQRLQNHRDVRGSWAQVQDHSGQYHRRRSVQARVPEDQSQQPDARDHRSNGPDGKPIAIFESGAILTYLAEKTGKLMPSDTHGKYNVMQWLMFQMASVGPMLGQAHYFRVYAPEKFELAINRYTNEAKRIYGVIDKQLSQTPYIAGEYSIADVAIYPWLITHNMQGQNLDHTPHLKKCFEALRARPAVQAGFAPMADQQRVARPLDQKA